METEGLFRTDRRVQTQVQAELTARHAYAGPPRGARCAAAPRPALAHASFLSGDALDTAANVLSWFVIIVRAVVGDRVFLYVHVLPEKIAEKRHHPQKDSIKVLCILSLFFGGMLWPFAWLWAYTRPVGYRVIYGTEKHEDYYLEHGEKARAGELPSERSPTCATSWPPWTARAPCRRS